MARRKAADDLSITGLLGFAKEELQGARKGNRHTYQPYPKQEDFHRSDKLGRYISGANRAGKCIIEGTEIQMADGSVKRIEDIVPGEYVIAPDGTATRVLEVWDKGLQPVNTYRIGRYQDVVEVSVTDRHRFWSAKTGHGRKLKEFQRHEIRDLGPRDKIMRSQGTVLGGVRDARALMLGLMLGDGHFGPRWASNLQFTCADPTLIEDVPGEFFPRADPIQYGLNYGEDWVGYLSDWGLTDTRSGTKFIPPVVWTWDEKSIGELIAGLAAADGSWWTSTEGEHHFSYVSKSFELISEFRRLAGIRLGIWGSTITKNRDCWEISYGTREALAKLAELPIPGRKKALAEAAVPVKDSKSSYVRVIEHTELGMRQCYDLSVEHDSHCFMLANGIFTSNTDAEVMEAIWWCTNTHPWLKRPESWGDGPIQGRFVVVDIVKGVEGIILPKLKRWCSTSDFINGKFDDSWDNRTMTFTFKNGSTIQFLTHGMELDRHGGVPLHFVFFDEIPPYNVFGENLQRLNDYKGFWVIAATAVQGMGWTYDLIWEPWEQEGDFRGRPIRSFIDCFQFKQSDNPYLEANEEERALYTFGMTEEERAIREDGAFVAKTGLVFPNFKKATHVLSEPLPLHMFRDWEWYSSVDFGWNNPTAWLWHAVHRDGRIYTFAEAYGSNKTTPEWAQIIHEREAAFGKSPEVRVGDPAGNQKQMNTGTSVISEYSRRGIYIATEGIPKDPMIGIEKMQQYLQILPFTGWGRDKPTWMISPNCVNFIRELGRMKFASYESDKKAYDSNKKEEVHKKDDHAFDSAKYFATLMPDLRPLLDETTNGSSMHLSFTDIMQRLREDPEVEIFNETWDTQEVSQSEVERYW